MTMEKKELLSTNEELELVKAIQSGSEEAIGRLKQTRLRFVEAVAKQYQNRGLTFEELVEEGNEGLITAAKKFDEQRGLKFPSYAVWWIRNSIKWAVQQKTIEMMDNTKNLVYWEFFANSEIPGAFEKTEWHGKPSDNSFSFVVDEHDKCKSLIEIFGIKNEELFREKYNQAINGDGNEKKRINVLHSSSLAALLFFYGIDENHPLKLEIEGIDYTFDRSFFEVKTVVKGTHQSNMDVVLEGKNVQGESVALFLECKFSEYLNSGKYAGISAEVYKQAYTDLGLFKPSTLEPIMAREENGELELMTSKPYHYCAGIKQMISHYMGVRNYAERGDNALDENSQFKGKHPDVILLGEILFKFDEKVDPKGKYGIYAEDYRKLAKTINEKNTVKKLRMLNEILCYQDIENSALDVRVKRFYQYQ